METLYKEPKFIVQVYVDGKLNGCNVDPLNKVEAEKYLNEVYMDLMCAQREQGKIIAHEVKYDWFQSIPKFRRELHPRAMFLRLFQSQRRTPKRIFNTMFSFELVPVCLSK